jgi:acetolactate synthase-1/2/3 large subunit
MLNVSDQIARYLKKNSVEQIFTVTGGGAMFLNKAFNDVYKNNVCYMHHEQACAMAAEGYARINNKPAIVNVTSGPGGINALNGVFGAYTDSIPMIIISGQVKNETLVRSYPDKNLRQLGDQEAKIEEIVKPICKFVAAIKKTSELETKLPKAIYEATNGRPGPVWIDIPADIQMDRKKINFKKIKKPLQINKQKYLKAFIKLNLLLEDSKRPLILAGTGIRLSSTTKDLLNFSKRLNIPIATAWTHDLIESKSKYFAGRPGTIGTRPGNFCLQNCDLLIVLGSRLNIRQTGFNFSGFSKNAKIIHVDIDKSELNKFYLNTAIKLHLDLKDFFELANKYLKPRKTNCYSGWVNWCNDIKKQYSIKNENFQNEKKGYLNPYKALFKISDFLKENDAIVCGNASACIVPFQSLEIKKNQRLFSNSGSASMGYDLPAAIGASIALKNINNSRVICFAGDGSLQMNIQELQTLFSMNLNLKMFILNNNGYLSIKSTHQNFFGTVFGSHPESGIDFPDFLKVAKAYKIPSYKVSSYKKLEEMKEFLEEKGPLIIELLIDTEQEFTPKLKSRMEKNGNFITPELDDMYPFLQDNHFIQIKEELKNIKT